MVWIQMSGMKSFGKGYKRRSLARTDLVGDFTQRARKVPVLGYSNIYSSQFFTDETEIESNATLWATRIGRACGQKLETEICTWFQTVANVGVFWRL